MGVPLNCPSFSTLSARLPALNISAPRFKKSERIADDIHAIAIDSTGLKRFGRGEWHKQKYELSNKASWRKLHLAVNEDHYIEGSTLTDRFAHDDSQVGALLKQVNAPIDHFTADGAYDETPIYEQVVAHSADADIVIPPRANAVISKDSAKLRNRNIEEIKTHGRAYSVESATPFRSYSPMDSVLFRQRFRCNSPRTIP